MHDVRIVREEEEFGLVLVQREERVRAGRCHRQRGGERAENCLDMTPHDFRDDARTPDGGDGREDGVDEHGGGRRLQL